MIRLMVANLADSRTALTRVTGQAPDYALLNECRTQVRRGLALLPRLPGGWGYWPPSGSQNVHLWRRGQVGIARPANGRRVLMQGGHRGAGKSARDRRRRGPSRDAGWQLTFDPTDGSLVIFVGMHLAAKGSTTARWRMPLVRASLVRLRLLTYALRARYPGVPIIVAGDGNLPHLGDWHMGKGWTNVPTPADYGKARHYLQVWTYGRVAVGRVKAVKVSDHRGLVMDVALGQGTPTFGGIQ